MSWTEFLVLAFPESMAEAEATRSFVWKINRKVGLRFAYLFFNIGFSGNMLSSFRVLIALAGFILLSMVIKNNMFLPFLGVILLAFQVHLDFADGAIARVQGKSSEFGEKLDGLANVAVRAAMIIFFGYLSENLYCFWASVFSGVVLSHFWDITSPFFVIEKKYTRIRKLYKLSSSVIIMVIVIPFCIAVLNFLGASLLAISYLLIWVYACLALFWLVLCWS